jgi:hypothetical protein
MLAMVQFHPPSIPKSHKSMIINARPRFPKPLVPVQVRAGAPNRGHLKRCQIFGVDEQRLKPWIVPHRIPDGIDLEDRNCEPAGHTE